MQLKYCDFSDIHLNSTFAKLGYSRELIRPTNETYIPQSYIEVLNDNYAEGKISETAYKEYLTDAGLSIEDLKIEEEANDIVEESSFDNCVLGNLYRFKDNGEDQAKGEAAVLTVTEILAGTVCSDNLSDVMPYIKRHDMPLKTTLSIIYDVYSEEYISYKEGNMMIRKIIKQGNRISVTIFQKVIDWFEKGKVMKH
ncbi:MAG: hypothetical protein K9K76_10245 [Halanaerobiales bacterium]|nr:hypothetical protein [Halanaerobiales bacterium]